MEPNNSKDEHVKEVYARFGLALYFAQVLEHGIVNALVVLNLIPSRRHIARTRAEWELLVDSFMDSHFESTMGKLISNLSKEIEVPADLENLLQNALSKRNWLAHGFFRERAAELLNPDGREKMIVEVDECREIFITADKRLEEIVRPLRIKVGITDEILEQEYNSLTTPTKAF